MMKTEAGKGEIYRVAGPVVTATGVQPRMYDVMFVGAEQLLGEVIQIAGEKTVIQVYEETSGVRPGEPVVDTRAPLTVELGPGLLGSIYDGVQRPLPILQKAMGDYVLRGVKSPGLSREKSWKFAPKVKTGQTVGPGEVVGTVQEAKNVEHRIMVPPGARPGKVTSIRDGNFHVEDVVAELDSGVKVRLKQDWPVRRPRPAKDRLMPTIPLVTGQRVLDFLFPIAKGGTAAIPGGFGTGKCVVGSTPVFLADGRLVRIQDLYNAFAPRGEREREESIVSLPEPLPVFTLGHEGIRVGRATALYRGRTHQLTEVRLRSGRGVRLTPIHRLFRFRDGEIEEVPAAELRQGDALVVPRKLALPSMYLPVAIPSRARVADQGARERVAARMAEVGTAGGRGLGLSPDTYWNYRLQRTAPPVGLALSLGVPVRRIRAERSSKAVAVPERFDEAVAEYLGLLSSEGMIKSGRVVEFYNNDRTLLDRYRGLLWQLFGLTGTERRDRTVMAISVASRALVLLLQEWGFPTRAKSRTLSLVKALAASPETVVAAFLRAYAAGDGHFGQGTLEISTASPQMASGLAYLFARVGIFARATGKTVGGRRYSRVWISPKEAQRLFPSYARDSYYDSYDVVPLGPSVVSGIRSSIESIDGRTLTALRNATGGQRVSRATLRHVLSIISPHTPAGQVVARLDGLLDHVLIDRVVSVRTWDETSDVYDLTVEDTHNFVGGELPMFLHNTVTEQQLSKWCDAQVVIYIGCGERGNEMTEVLTLFPKLEDPYTGAPLMERMALIANTSNMPVAAREASVYTGMTLAEYYRDMGYNVALMADSTSRWAEAMREISSRLEEMPGEEGFPAYLSARLSEFYERAGRVRTLGGAEGSVSVVGAVSPSGGDFSEPVTQGTIRIVKVFWALDTALRARRHFPAINWLTSYSLYASSLEEWFRKNVNEEWPPLRTWAQRTLQEEAELEEIVRLVGADALPPDQQFTLEVARMIREIFLQQNARHPVDTFCPPERQFKLISAIRRYADLGRKAVALDVPVKDVAGLKSRELLTRVKYETEFDRELEKAVGQMEEEFKRMEAR